ncbi:hypothetical protein CCHL11_08076 [Colletotrichum chlorophyti]|uniref:Uncharacterized protein n=1 Tax=Colletotrichum chlorophyti TaxID=708187 RepID=A0A1Q8RMH1_9PEZI|nr:hypothetical protein CCHL11_08076 [Colletotrichum chlorophyti]
MAPPKTTNARGTLQLTAVGENTTRFSWSGASDWTDEEYKPVLAGILEEMFTKCMESIAAKLQERLGRIFGSNLD